MSTPEESVEQEVEADFFENPEAVFARIFPGESFGNGHKWNKALSDLNACIEEFLIVRQVREEPALRSRALLSAFYARNNEAFFRRNTQGLLEYFADKNYRETTEDWQLQFWIRKQAVSYPLASQVKDTETLMTDLARNLNTYFLISGLQLACNRVTVAGQLQLKNEMPLPDDNAEYLGPVDDSALVILYRSVYHLLSSQEALFEPFFSLLKNYGPRVKREELESLVGFTFNFCIRRHRAGDPQAFGWYRQVYDWADREKVWVGSVKIEDTFLNNGIMFARSKDTRAFDAYVENGKSALPKDRRKVAEQLLRAYQLFYLGHFDQTASLLLTLADIRQPRYTLYYHSLKVRNLYELWRRDLAEYDSLELALANYEGFLVRNNFFSQAFRQAYRNQIWFVRKLMHYGEKRALSRDELLKAMKQRQPATGDWITAKIDELSKTP